MKQSSWLSEMKRYEAWLLLKKVMNGNEYGQKNYVIEQALTPG